MRAWARYLGRPVGVVAAEVGPWIWVAIGACFFFGGMGVCFGRRGVSGYEFDEDFKSEVWAWMRDGYSVVLTRFGTWYIMGVSLSSILHS